MSGQTVYNQEFSNAFAGMLAEGPGNLQRIISKTVKAAVSFSPGLFVCKRTADDTCDVPAAAGDVTTTGFGIGIRNVAQEPHNGTGSIDGGTVEFNPLQQISILEKGVIWVLTEAAVNYGDPAFARITANGGNTTLGKLGKTADSGNATAITGAKFIDTIAAAGLARVLLA